MDSGLSRSSTTPFLVKVRCGIMGIKLESPTWRSSRIDLPRSVYHQNSPPIRSEDVKSKRPISDLLWAGFHFIAGSPFHTIRDVGFKAFFVQLLLRLGGSEILWPNHPRFDSKGRRFLSRYPPDGFTRGFSRRSAVVGRRLRQVHFHTLCHRIMYSRPERETTVL